MAIPAVLAVLALAAQAPGAAPRAEQDCASALESLVDAPTREARRAAAAALARSRAGELQAFAAAMAAFGRFEDAPRGVRSQTVELEVCGEREATELWTYVPSGYDPSKPAPLMLAFHGTGGSGRGMHALWQKVADAAGMLVLAPSEAGENTGYRFSDRERMSALAALRWMRRRHNVDENRIYASGISRGGHLTWDLALRHPDVFAAVAPMIGCPRISLPQGQNNMRLLENVAQLPIRDLQGSQDDPNLVALLRLSFDLLRRFAPRDAQLIEFADRGHDFDFAAVDWQAWLGSAVRDPAPGRVVRCTATKNESRAFWLEITGFGKQVDESFRPKVQQSEYAAMDDDAKWRLVVAEAVERNARAVARRTGPGAFSVELDGATKVRLYLRAEDLAPGGTVKCSIGGKVTERKARADLKVMLEDFAERFDRTCIARGAVEVP